MTGSILYVLYIFAFLGCIFAVAILLLMVTTFWEWAEDQIAIAKYNHKKKHRFDKPPTAKCYCKDCYDYTSIECYCVGLNIGVNDNDFCSFAKPRKHDPEKKK